MWDNGSTRCCCDNLWWGRILLVGESDDSEPADEATIVAEQVNRSVTQRFVRALANHRLWSREPRLHLPL